MLFCLAALFLCLSINGQTKRALLVGLSEYSQNDDEAWEDIHGANDVSLLSSTLKEQGFKTKVLTNKSATAKGIRNQLRALSDNCKKGDYVYIHFSSHGQPVEDLNNDEEDGWDEAIVPYDAKKYYDKGLYEGENHILDDELYSYFSSIRTAIGSNGFLCVVIDACHAGGASRGEEDEEDIELFCRGTKFGFGPSGKSYNPRINTKGHFMIEQSTNQSEIIILEACRSYQSNYEIKQDGKYYGPLSYYVNKTLKDTPLSADITWVLNVKAQMDSDKRLTRQNMVYETSLKPQQDGR